MSQRLIDAKSQQRNDADWAAYHLRLAIDALLAITHDRSNYSNNEWLKHAKDASLMFVCFVLSIDDAKHPANSLRLCANALETLPGTKLPELSKDKRSKGKFDFLIIKAYAKAALTGKRKAERGPNGDPLFSEVNDALADIGESEWKANGVAWKRPNEDHLRRVLKCYDLTLSEKARTTSQRSPHWKIKLPRHESWTAKHRGNEQKRRESMKQSNRERERLRFIGFPTLTPVQPIVIMQPPLKKMENK